MNAIFSIPTTETGKASRMYAMILSTENSGQVWRVSASAFEAYAAPNYASYVIAVTEVGTTGVYQFTLPVPLQIPGKRYVVLVREKALPSDPPAVTDALTQTGAIEVSQNIPATTAGVEVRSD